MYVWHPGRERKCWQKGTLKAWGFAGRSSYPQTKAVVGISVLCMLALLPDPLSLLSDHVDAALRESAKGHCEGVGPSYFFHTKKDKKGCLLSFQCHCPICESILWNIIPKQRIRR
ncbi:hypothetical protein QL285_077545 [Trifolium repens]|nr:hypothetical protein QL285_077545 [Trifolium repens]